MAVDKNLFLYDLAIVAIMKNEAPYIKEWLDYHLLAGVDHFYIYDNDSPDNQKEILQPYIDAELVTYIFYPGKVRQVESYNDAVQKFRFFCRYMAFIDGDEFIFPKSNASIVDVTEEILSENPNAAGVAINWQLFGSNGQEKADYNRGVLERFTARAPFDHVFPAFDSPLPGGNAHTKVIADPRKIKFFHNPHFPIYFEQYFSINEQGAKVDLFYSLPITVSKIALNHYYTKSLEEYKLKMERGNADSKTNEYQMKVFYTHDKNEVFDDAILKYRDNRKENFNVHKNEDFSRAANALIQNLSPTFTETVPGEFFRDKIENFLICLALSTHLREKFFTKTTGNFFEELSLQAINKTILSPISLYGARLLFSELPHILNLNYPIVEDIRQNCLKLIESIMNFFRLERFWQDFTELNYLSNLLKTFDSYEKKFNC